MQQCIYSNGRVSTGGDYIYEYRTTIGVWWLGNGQEWKGDAGNQILVPGNAALSNGKVLNWEGMCAE